MYEELLRLLGYGLCHQLPERSFVAAGVQLPVCARDTGLYVGFVLAVLVLQVLGRARRSEPPRWPLVVLAVAFVGAMGLDGINSNTGLFSSLWATTNDTRLATGLLTGLAISLFVTPIVNGQLWRDPSGGRVLSGPWETAVWLASAPAGFVLTRWGLPLLGPVFPAIVAVCIILTFWWVNLAIVCLIPAFERRATKLSDAWPAHLLALALTAVELVAGALFRWVMLSVLS